MWLKSNYDLSDVIAIKSVSSFSGITYMSKTVKSYVHGQTVFPVGLYFVVALFPPPCTIYIEPEISGWLRELLQTVSANACIIII